MHSPEQLRLLLEKYELVTFADLGSVLTTPSALYRSLNDIHQEAFAPNQRIVFYTSQEVNKDMLDHIHQTLSLIDIAGCFVLLCSPNITAEQVRGYEDPISTLQINLAETITISNSYIIPKTYCPLPWLHLEIKHNGDIYPCCVSETRVASAGDGGLQEVIAGKAMHELRQDFLAGIKPNGCQHCWQLEDAGLTSNRQWHVKHYSKRFYSDYVDSVKIRSLDIKPGNVCNFKCRICNPTSSSLFADEAHRNSKNIKIKTESELALKNGRWVEYNDYMWTELKDLLPNIENLDFYGGEPFLVKQIPELLNYAVENNYAQNIRVHINSNGSIYPEKLIPTLLKFKYIDIALSIDDVGSRFELERGGEWREVANNILRFAQLRNNSFEVYLMPTINIQNVLYIDELLNWANTIGLRVTLNYLDNPKWANITNMTKAAQQLVVDKYNASSNQDLRNIANRVAMSTGSNGITFVERMQAFDSVRSQNFGNTHPEIAQAMGYF